MAEEHDGYAGPWQGFLSRFDSDLGLTGRAVRKGRSFILTTRYCGKLKAASSGNWYHAVPSGNILHMKDNPPKGRWKLTEPLYSDLLDFCEAHRGSPEHRIIADALRAFIDERLGAEPELKRRFEEARKARLGQATKVVKLVDKQD
jgi:hypothetical protein